MKLTNKPSSVQAKTAKTLPKQITVKPAAGRAGPAGVKRSSVTANKAGPKALTRPVPKRPLKRPPSPFAGELMDVQGKPVYNANTTQVAPSPQLPTVRPTIIKPVETKPVVGNSTTLYPVANKKPQFDSDGFGRRLHPKGWRRKKELIGRGPLCCEYNSGDNNYRTYPPTISSTADGGLLVSTSIDHMRGLRKDDHCGLSVTFDSSGKIYSVSRAITIYGRPPVENKNFHAAKNIGASYSALAVIIDMCDRMFAGVPWGSTPGRMKFPDIIKHNICAMTDSVRLQ